MLGKLVLAFAALQAGIASAGNAIVANRCPYDIWVWSVDQGHSFGPYHVPARSRHVEAFRSVCNGCGTSLKVSRTDQLLNGQQTQFEYSIKNNQLWYDISFVNCADGSSASNCPGHEMGLAITSPDGACTQPNCAANSYCPTQSYYVDFPGPKLGLKDPVFSCPANAGTGMDLYFEVCSGQAPLKRSIAGRLMMDLEG